MTLQVCGGKDKTISLPGGLVLTVAVVEESSSYLEALLLTWACISDSHQRPVASGLRKLLPDSL